MQTLWIVVFFLQVVISDGAYVWNKLKTTTSYYSNVNTASSGTGQYVYVAASSYLWRSDNYGAASSWQACHLISSTLISSIDEVVVSDSGELVFVLSHDPSHGGIYRSSSYGVNNTYSKLDLGYDSVGSLSVSADGQILTATFSSMQSPKALLSFSAGDQSTWTIVSEPQGNNLGASYGRNTVISGDGKVLYTSIQGDGNRVCHLNNVSQTFSCEYFTWNLMAAMATTFDGSILYYLDTRGDFNVYQYATSFSSRASIGIDGYGFHLSCSKWGQKIVATNTNSSSKSFVLYNSDYGMAQWEVVGPFAYIDGTTSGFEVPERISNVAMNRNGSHWFMTTSTLWNEWYYSTRKPVTIFSLQSTPETADAIHVFTTSQPSKSPTQGGASQSSSSSSSSSVSYTTIGIIVGAVAVALLLAIIAFFCRLDRRSVTSPVPDRVEIQNSTTSSGKDLIAEPVVAEPMIISVEAVAYQPGNAVLGSNPSTSFVPLSTVIVNTDPVPSAPMMIPSSYVPYTYRPAPSSYVPYSNASVQES